MDSSLFQSCEPIFPTILIVGRALIKDSCAAIKGHGKGSKVSRHLPSRMLNGMVKNNTWMMVRSMRQHCYVLKTMVRYIHYALAGYVWLDTISVSVMIESLQNWSVIIIEATYVYLPLQETSKQQVQNLSVSGSWASRIQWKIGSAVLFVIRL